MSFLLYKTVREGDHNRYEYLKVVSLSGDGPIKHFALAERPMADVPYGWHLPGHELALSIADRHAMDCAIVIDLKPNVKNNASLFLLKDVWGYTYPNHTLLALLMQTLFDKDDITNPAFKENFTDEGADRRLVGEFLYLRGGTREGYWNWGQAGRVNGALFWKESFEYLGRNLSAGLSLSLS